MIATPVETTPISTLSLMRMYAVMQQRLKALATEKAQLDAFAGTIAKQLVDRLPENAEQFSHTFEDGVTIIVGLKSRERWVPVDGQSDDFWGWVFANNHAQQFCTRELKQEGVDKWREAHKTVVMPDGELPPFICRMTVVEPKIGVKGLTQPKSTPTT